MVYRFNITLPDGHILLLGFTSQPSWESLWDEFNRKSTELRLTPTGHLIYEKCIINDDFSLGVMFDGSPDRLLWELHLDEVTLVQPGTRTARANESDRSRNPSGDVDDLRLEQDMNERYERNIRLGRLALSPSEAARSERLEAEQADCPIYNGRPGSRYKGSPVQIFHPSFGRFIDSLESSPSDVSVAFRHLVGELMERSNREYATEEERVTIISETLTKLLNHNVLRAEHVRAFPGAYGTRVDGQCTLQFQDDSGTLFAIPTMMMEVKNSSGKGSTDAYMQAGFTCRKAVVSDPETFRIIRDSSCFPVLLLSITGPYLLVSGFIFADYAVQQALTPQLLLWDATPDDSMTQSVVRTLWAVRTFLQELPAYYQQILRTPPSRVPTDARFPYFVTFAEDGCTFRLRYLKRMFPDQANRNIFLARVVQGASTKLSHNQLVVVKFSTRYGKDAHATLARERLAPRMYHHSELPGGVLVTVMEYLQGRSLEHGYGTVPPSRIHAPVRRAIEILHAQNIVFGDLRLGNIMLLTNNTTPRVISRDISSSSSSSANVEASRVMLIDFDWCAKEGEGKYPPLLNTKVDWADGVEPEGVMMKSHDEAMLARLSSAAS